MGDGLEPTPPAANPHRLIGELRVTDGPDAGKMFAVREDAVVGRDDGADIVLVDATGELSRRHVRIGVDDGVALLEDLDSTNGTFLNDERIHGPHPLQAGDRIRIGASTLVFAPAPELQVTRAREVPSEFQVTRAREVPSEFQVTRAREVPSEFQVTRAREISPELHVTRARDKAPPSGAAHHPPTVEAPPSPPGRSPTFAPPSSDGELLILSGPGAGNKAPVLGGSATIGREPECDLQVLDSEVSRRHAKVTIRDGTAVIDDLHSSNGTYVNGERILTGYALAPGDHIEIGEATIELTSPVFANVKAHAPPVQISAVRDVLTQPAKLLGAESGNRKWWTLAVVSTVTFMLLLDVTIVAVALPTISKALHPSFSSLQWIVGAYTLGLTIALLTAGSMADMFGRKRVLSIGLIGFMVTSVICAQAPNATVLDFARGLQGISGAIMFACGLALIVQEFPAGERKIAFGVYGATNGVSVAIGPIIGGLLVQGIGWQSIFYLNLPIGIAAFVGLQRKVVNLPGPPTRIDWGGLVTFSAATFMAVFATIRGNDNGWTSGLILGLYAGAIVLFAAFILIEMRREHPMLDLGLFRNPTFIGSSVSAITACFSVLALIFFLTTWLQSVLGYSPVGAGTRMLVFSGAALIVAPAAGRMTGTVSPRIVLTAGLVLIAAGVLSMTAVDAASRWTAILPGLVLTGLGLGMINPTLASTAVSVVPPWRGGMASGINSTCREAGTTAGIAVMGTVLQHQVQTHVHHALAGTAAAAKAATIGSAISVGGTPQVVARAPASQRAALLHTAHLSYAAGLDAIFYVAFAVAVVGAVVAFALVRRSHLRADATGAAH